MTIEGYEVEVKLLARTWWSISVISPEKTKFGTVIRAFELDEPRAYDIFKKHKKAFFIEVDAQVQVES